MSILFFSNLPETLNGRTVVEFDEVSGSFLMLSISVRIRTGSRLTVKQSWKYLRSARLALIGKYSSLPWILRRYLSVSGWNKLIAEIN